MTGRTRSIAAGIVVATLAGSLVLTALAAPLAGWPLWIAVLIMSVTWLVLLTLRVGGAMAWPLALLATLGVLLGAFVAAPLVQAPLVPFIAGFVGLVGLAGCALLVRTRSRHVMPSRAALIIGGASAAGSVAWMATLGWTTFVDPVRRLTWTMAGDSANNLIYARNTVELGGIHLPGVNPVPLPPALLTLGFAPGRDGVASADLLTHDLAAVGQVWGIVIAVVCLTVGSTIATIVRAQRGSTLVSALGGAAGSLAALGWLTTGYGLEYGFLSVHVVLPVALASISIASLAGRRPGLALAGIVAAAGLTLSIWSPLVVIPVVLGVLVLVRHRVAVFRGSRTDLVLLIVTTVAAIAYAVVGAIPSYLSQREALTALGGIVHLKVWFLLAAAIVLVAVAAIAARITDRIELLAGAVVVASVGLVSIAFLLFLSRRAADPWTYYPLKFSWILLVIDGICVLALLLVITDHSRSVPGRVVAAVAAVAVTAVAAFWVAPPEINGYHHIAAPTVIFDAGQRDQSNLVAAEVLKLADPEHPAIPWQSSLPDDTEHGIRMWLTLLAAGSLAGDNELRLAGIYSYRNLDLKLLCTIGREMGPDLIVLTASPDLAGEVAERCPGAGMIVRDEDFRLTS